MLAVIAFHKRKAILIDSSVFSSNGFVVAEKVPTGALKVQFFFHYNDLGAKNIYTVGVGWNSVVLCCRVAFCC